MKFLKENSYDIVKLYINQVGIAIFSMLLYVSVSMIKNTTLSLRLKISISVFAMLFYFVLLYTAAWDMGAKDRIRVDAGRMKEDKIKGLKMSLIANIPNLILSVGSMLFTWIYIINSDLAFIKVLNTVFTAVLRLSCSMYLGLIQGIFNSLSGTPEFVNIIESCAFMVAPLLAILSTHIGYLFGLKNKKIFAPKKANR